MKSIFKKILGWIIEITYIHFMSTVKKCSAQSIENVVVILDKPLGVGDIVMLSPLIVLLEEKYNVTVVSSYPNIFSTSSNWVEPKNLDLDILRKSLLISPTTSFKNIKYIRRAKSFLGYFASFTLRTSLNSESYRKYDIRNDHYLEKIIPIISALNVECNHNEFSYPNLASSYYKVPFSDYIVVVPYSNWLERQLPQYTYIELIRKLIKLNKNVIILGSPNVEEVSFNKNIEESLNSTSLLNLTGQTTLLEMIYVINKSRSYYGNDSGPSHIAYLLDVPATAFFGCVTPETRLPLNRKLTSDIKTIDCRESCELYPCYDGMNKPTCNNVEKYKCLTSINVKNLEL